MKDLERQILEKQQRLTYERQKQIKSDKQIAMANEIKERDRARQESQSRERRKKES